MNTHGSQKYHLLGRRVHQPLINPRCVGCPGIWKVPGEVPSEHKYQAHPPVGSVSCLESSNLWSSSDDWRYWYRSITGTAWRATTPWGGAKMCRSAKVWCDATDRHSWCFQEEGGVSEEPEKLTMNCPTPWTWRPLKFGKKIRPWRRSADWKGHYKLSNTPKLFASLRMLGAFLAEGTKLNYTN